MNAIHLPDRERDMPTGGPTRSDDDAGASSGGTTAVRNSTWSHPFAWQDGRRLWILDSGPDDWTLAELRFEPESCRYFEVRRATYRWFREAAGAFLSRALSGGQHHAETAASGLTDWARRNQIRSR
ncbi:MAG: hypothetical protein U0031_13540 [Thermomicrobiales bacterium]